MRLRVHFRWPIRSGLTGIGTLPRGRKLPVSANDSPTAEQNKPADDASATAARKVSERLGSLSLSKPTFRAGMQTSFAKPSAAGARQTRASLGPVGRHGRSSAAGRFRLSAELGLAAAGKHFLSGGECRETRRLHGFGRRRAARSSHPVRICDRRVEDPRFRQGERQRRGTADLRRDQSKQRGSAGADRKPTVPGRPEADAGFGQDRRGPIRRVAAGRRKRKNSRSCGRASRQAKSRRDFGAKELERAEKLAGNHFGRGVGKSMREPARSRSLRQTTGVRLAAFGKRRRGTSNSRPPPPKSNGPRP